MDNKDGCVHKLLKEVNNAIFPADNGLAPLHPDSYRRKGGKSEHQTTKNNSIRTQIISIFLLTLFVSATFAQNKRQQKKLNRQVEKALKE